jgi:translation initiation factor 4A
MNLKNETTTNNNNLIKGWEDETLNLKQTLLRGIYAFGFENPSSIQKKAILPFTKLYGGKRKDIVAQAQSGTGKTGCFVVSALQIIDETLKKTQAIILAPTHELAHQIVEVVRGLGHYMKIQTQLLIGGRSVDQDKKELDANIPQIIVGTPGRMHDILRRKWIKTKDVKLLVMDEADEMLSSGFLEQMYKIFQYMPEEIQIGLFSATMPDELQKLNDDLLRNPTKILVKADELTLQGISQYYISLDDDLHKYETIKDLFSNLSITQAIIYCNSTRRVDDLEEAMKQDQFPVEKVHGKMSSGERHKIFKEFKNGGCRVLITSDLFARGIDVQQVSIVINFDIPKNEHTYLHRIGRSGRWGRKGIAINFQTKYDIVRLDKFREHYDTEIIEMPCNYTSELQI